MDDADRAKQLEMQQRQRAIDNALSEPDHGWGESQLTVSNEIVCIDCYDPIPKERLAIKPDACRCVDCKEVWEKKR